MNTHVMEKMDMEWISAGFCLCSYTQYTQYISTLMYYTMHQCDNRIIIRPQVKIKSLTNLVSELTISYEKHLIMSRTT